MQLADMFITTTENNENALKTHEKRKHCVPALMSKTIVVKDTERDIFLFHSLHEARPLHFGVIFQANVKLSDFLFVCFYKKISQGASTFWTN